MGIAVAPLLLAVQAHAQNPSKTDGSSTTLPRVRDVVLAQAQLEQVGVDAARLGEARDYALTGAGSGCILRGGRLVAVWGMTEAAGLCSGIAARAKRGGQGRG